MVSGRMYSAPANRKLNFKQVKQVQKIVESNKQLKRVDIATNGNFFTTAALMETTSLAKGDENDERDTDRINLLKVEIQTLLYTPSTSTLPLLFRAMLVRSKVGPLVSADFPGYQGTPDYDKMQVYHDQLHILGPYSTVATQAFSGGNIKQIKIIKSFKNKKIPHLNVLYDTDVSATSAQSNPIYYYLVASTATNIVYSNTSKITWYDKD